MSARFLRHEGFLGAVGAFLKVHPMTPPNQPASVGREPRKVSALELRTSPLPSSTRALAVYKWRTHLGNASADRW